MSEKTCGNCGRSSAVVTPSGHDTGFSRCELMPKHIWLSQSRECSFVDCRWQPKLQKAA